MRQLQSASQARPVPASEREISVGHSTLGTLLLRKDELLGVDFPTDALCAQDRAKSCFQDSFGRVPHRLHLQHGATRHPLGFCGEAAGKCPYLVKNAVARRDGAAGKKATL